MRLIFLLQYLIPLAVVGVLIWWFVLKPLFSKSIEQDIASEETEAIRERLKQAFPEDDVDAETRASDDEIESAINEIKDL